MGVSIAYFASIALLALASQEPRSSTGMGDTTTYFDSVVFLTMFLLIGKFLAYSYYMDINNIACRSFY